MIASSCSSSRILQESRTVEETKIERDTVLSSASSLNSNVLKRDAIEQQAKLSTLYGIDSAFIGKHGVHDLLKLAKERYETALKLQKLGMEDSSAVEFERAIEVLNDLSYCPDVLGNRKFVKLSKEIIRDYKKYIRASQNLAPASSVFALREKLAQIVDTIHVKGNWPKSETVLKTTIPLVMNRYVRENLRFFQTRGRSYMQNWIYRSGKYIPMMKTIFRKEHVPPELAYLSLPESGLNPKARSWANAVGLWQFIRSTGARYGLRSNWWYDERRDPVLSTEAAGRLLKNLHDQLGNWYLAIAAYDCGDIAVNWAIRRAHGSRNFWKIMRYLPWETRNYVPQYIAVTLIAMSPKKFGFDGKVTTTPIAYDTVTVPADVELNVLSRVTGVDLDSLISLNPMLIHPITPPNFRDGFFLKVPIGTARLFAENYSRFAASERPVWMYHTVRRGETLSGIASHYGMSLGRLMGLNHLRGSLIRPGMRLYVVYSYARYRGETAGRTGRPSVGFHRVRMGETLGQIALAYGVTVHDLRVWNGIPGSFIRAGQSLRVAPPRSDEGKRADVYAEGSGSKAVYRVKRGDSLWEIAKKFGVSMTDLRVWNGNPTELRPGQLIVISN
ncbi:MAG: LysM peptidoglycan-binding domain-containing protein [Bacteroidetes bacterium]|nr:LysM peptidoglycan-binding domain-containing protein [Bacteroidota bacterium]